MKNKLGDLNDHLFAQMERLAEGDLGPEELEQEAKRAEAMVQVSDRITGTAQLQLNAAKLYAEHGQGVLAMLPQVGQAKGPKEIEE